MWPGMVPDVVLESEMGMKKWLIIKLFRRKNIKNEIRSDSFTRGFDFWSSYLKRGSCFFTHDIGNTV